MLFHKLLLRVKAVTTKWVVGGLKVKIGFCHNYKIKQNDFGCANFQKEGQ